MLAERLFRLSRVDKRYEKPPPRNLFLVPCVKPEPKKEPLVEPAYSCFPFSNIDDLPIDAEPFDDVD